MPKPNKPVRAYDEFTTNIKGLPEGEYMTETGYSETYPYKVVERSASGKSVYVVPVKVKPDPEWVAKMEWVPGGFAGHCVNQSEQTWLYDGIDEKAKPRALRLKKSRYCGSDKLWGDKGREFIANGARYFYDYCF